MWPISKRGVCISFLQAPATTVEPTEAVGNLSNMPYGTGEINQENCYKKYRHSNKSCLLPGSLTAPSKFAGPQRERIVFQPSCFRGELLNFGGVNNHVWIIVFDHPKNYRHFSDELMQEFQFEMLEFWWEFLILNVLGVFCLWGFRFEHGQRHLGLIGSLMPRICIS